ncbi:uncharacterized protein LOC121976189 isoform X1 [Zingiber officinale]|uniref:uncharacterized protein LOC121976189 isoform X1 n=1 Tax=Zingiber officinale TaxID=94328 RepID=UPI001C4D5536|nr:uncharacterized protein LOC121976189 isoform X1 [Zingiber officinale]
MRSLTGLVIGLSLVSIFLFFALVATLYLVWRKKRINADIDENCSIPLKKLQYPFFWTWKSPSLMAIHQQERSAPVDLAAQSDQLHKNPSKDTIEAEILRLYSLAGPPRLLFTIKEETKEDLESEDGRCGGKTLNDLFNSSDDTPLSTSHSASPCTRNGYNFNREDDFTKMWSSPSPKFKFLKHAELKFYRKLLMEEAGKADANAEMVNDLEKQNMGREQEGDGSNFIGIVIGKIRDGEKHQHSSSSQGSLGPLWCQGCSMMHVGAFA